MPVTRSTRSKARQRGKEASREARKAPQARTQGTSLPSTSVAPWRSRAGRWRSRRRAPRSRRQRPPPPRSESLGAADHPRSGAAAVLARGLRADAGPGRGAAGQPLRQVVYGLTRPSGPATLTGPEPVDEDGQSARPRRRVGRGSLLVAGPHGPLRPAARRADDVHLARLVRQLQREGEQPAADARPERPVSRDGARQLPRPVRGGHRQPRDARVPRRDLQRTRTIPTRTTRAR